LDQQDLKKRFETEINEHTLLIHKICHMYAFNETDREDLFQNIVLQLWRSFPAFKGNSKVSTWIYRVAINTAISGLRKHKDFITSQRPEDLPMNIADESIDQLHDDRVEALNNAIGNLNDIEKAIVMLFLEDRSYAEMEMILGINQGTLRVKMNRIKDRLRELTKNETYGTR
jgi:RNA polymerase sigma factor (sigma-70 family)